MNKEALHKIGYGMYIVGAKGGDKLNGQIANAVFQVTAEPATVAVSINRSNLTHAYISEGKAFSLSVLEKDTPLKLIGHFGFKSGRDSNKYAFFFRAGANRSNHGWNAYDFYRQSN